MLHNIEITHGYGNALNDWGGVCTFADLHLLSFFQILDHLVPQIKKPEWYARFNRFIHITECTDSSTNALLNEDHETLKSLSFVLLCTRNHYAYDAKQ